MQALNPCPRPGRANGQVSNTQTRGLGETLPVGTADHHGQLSL